MRTLEVGIVGCGTAGPAAALFLARQGHRVTLFERVLDPKPIGAGIMLQPTGQAVLARLGLGDDVEARGARLDRLRVVREEQRPLMELRYADVDPAYFGLGMHRGALFEALYGAVLRSANITLRLGVTGENLERVGSRRYVIDGEGDRHGPFDLVVVADGARSRFRDDTSLTRVVEPYAWGALWFVARDPDRVFRDELYQVVRGNQAMLGLLPTGLGPRGASRRSKHDDEPSGPSEEVPLVSLYWSLRADREAEFRTSGFDAWRDEVRRMEPRAEAIIDQITDPDEVLFSAYHDVVMTSWSSRAVVHLGDAGHAMSPQLGQGANLALWDAMVLSDCIAAEPSDVARALDRYTRMRRGHLGYYQLATRWLTPFFQGDASALGWARDRFMPLASRIGPLRRAMTLGMSGVVDGHPWSRLPVQGAGEAERASVAG
jgi:2-polyprenyl-6-methoxyphenol hydroxylase-like FAD-dependent oxidoreductase